MPQELTPQLVKTTKPGAKPIIIRDTVVRGLLFRVQPSGMKTYYMYLRRNRQVRIGDATCVPLDRARERARELRTADDLAEDATTLVLRCGTIRPRARRREAA